MKTEAEKKKKLSPLDILGVVLCVILIPVLVINLTLIAKSFLNQDEVPRVGGYFPLIVLTDSMYPEIQSGDLIICHQEEAEELEKKLKTWHASGVLRIDSPKCVSFKTFLCRHT